MKTKGPRSKSCFFLYLKQIRRNLREDRNSSNPPRSRLFVKKTNQSNLVLPKIGRGRFSSPPPPPPPPPPRQPDGGKKSSTSYSDFLRPGNQLRNLKCEPSSIPPSLPLCCFLLPSLTACGTGLGLGYWGFLLVSVLYDTVCP